MNTRFTEAFLEDATETLRAVAHPIRLAIIDLLAQHGQLSVSDIHETLDIQQAVASHHLRILKSKDVVEVTREGKNSIYALSTADFSAILQVLEKVK
ncbi:MAG: helix-turn-helix transcriptional regulator [Saprospiraceae bacterium]|nr:helix-turn-helix transcriptional regulator [Saprospiraceae bacterium]